ncbi:MAG TPA: ParB/RepB/Spo0J family partition protein [Actinomycetota bacterium]|nr:ParB/RepB/Spo0J family partition protein [Actinomycetota bacterium]
MTRRSGLGRGLDALLPSMGDEGIETRSSSATAPVSAIDPNPNQPRKRFEQDALEELAASIADLGILQPLLVRPGAAGRFELIAGERRLRAAQRAGLTEVPVIVVETDDAGSLERALVENVHRSDLNPLEEAAAYQQLIDEGGLTQEQLGTKLGRNRTTIANMLRLLELPDPIKKLVAERRLSAGHARALLGLERNPFQERLARRVADEGLSVRDTEELVRKYQAMLPSAGSARPGGRPEQSGLVTDAQRRLSDHLQTRVRVEMGQRKGKITLDFVSLDELERLLDLLLPADHPAERAGPSSGLKEGGMRGPGAT